jgi:hypothetical protein
LDTFNKFVVGVQGDKVTIMNIAPGTIPKLSKPEALNLAAWLVSLADPTGDEFHKWLEAVQNT